MKQKCNKFTDLDLSIRIIATFHIVLIVILQVVAHKISGDLWQYGILKDYLHPIITFLFYSPALFSMKAVSLFILSSYRAKYFAGNRVVSITIFLVILFVVTVVIVITNPRFFVSWGIVIAPIIYYMVYLFSAWKYSHKYRVLLIIICIFLFMTSSFPYFIVVWFKFQLMHPDSPNFYLKTSSLPGNQLGVSSIYEVTSGY